MEKTAKYVPILVLCAAITLAPGCGGKKIKQSQEPKREVALVDMPLGLEDSNGPRFVFDDDIEAFVLDEANVSDNVTLAQASEPVLDFEWDALEKSEQVAAVYFPYDGKVPLANQKENMEKVDQLATALYEKGETICLKGHGCKYGTAAYNVALSNTRASTIKKHLVEELHIPESHIKTFGVGNEEPVAFEMTKEGQAPNRRVEIYGIKA